jgi:hypothetical protein
MREILIITEGPSEQEFVSSLLIPYFANEAISVYPKTIKTSKDHYGGAINYDRLKGDITRHLQSKKHAIISTFIDFYRISSKMPNYKESINEANVDKRIDHLLYGLIENIDAINSNIFVPYIQKREFESLLFSNIEWCLSVLDYNGQNKLQKILDSYNNPEDINDTTSPSNHLLDIFKQHSSEKYNKVLFGELIASQIGIETIIKKCPRFGNWIQNLIIQAKK